MWTKADREQESRRGRQWLRSPDTEDMSWKGLGCGVLHDSSPHPSLPTSLYGSWDKRWDWLCWQMGSGGRGIVFVLIHYGRCL